MSKQFVKRVDSSEADVAQRSRAARAHARTNAYINSPATHAREEDSGWGEQGQGGRGRGVAKRCGDDRDERERGADERRETSRNGERLGEKSIERGQRSATSRGG